MIPKDGWFQLGFTFSAKAVAVVKSSGLPQEIKALIPDSAECVCGYGLVSEIRTGVDAVCVAELMKTKNSS